MESDILSSLFLFPYHLLNVFSSRFVFSSRISHCGSPKPTSQSSPASAQVGVGKVIDREELKDLRQHMEHQTSLSQIASPRELNWFAVQGVAVWEKPLPQSN